MSDVIADIIRREGGFVNHTADKGGATKFGITQATLAAYRKVSTSIEDVRELSEMEARQIYETLYVRKPNFDQINNERLKNLVVDCGVNHGVSRAAKFLQKAIGVTVDGVCGPVTIGEVNLWKPRLVYNKVLAQRIKFYGKLISRKPSQAVFAEGWMNRVAEFLE